MNAYILFGVEFDQADHFVQSLHIVNSGFNSIDSVDKSIRDRNWKYSLPLYPCGTITDVHRFDDKGECENKARAEAGLPICGNLVIIEDSNNVSNEHQESVLEMLHDWMPSIRDFHVHSDEEFGEDGVIQTTLMNSSLFEMLTDLSKAENVAGLRWEDELLEATSCGVASCEMTSGLWAVSYHGRSSSEESSWLDDIWALPTRSEYE